MKTPIYNPIILAIGLVLSLKGEHVAASICLLSFVISEKE